MTDLYVENNINAPPLVPHGTQLGQFTINEMLAVGGFGQVYRGTVTGSSYPVIVKIESITAKLHLLYSETSCLKSLNQVYNPNGATNVEPFLKYYGYGTTGGIRYLVMEKCGENIRDLKKMTVLDRFSIPTSLWILYQMISSLEKMHNIGWLHRDVKPANFCIGLNSLRSLFVLDFGMSKCYVEKDGNLKPRQISSPFHGTLRYVSLNIHKRQDASRWDDIWSAFYIAVENMVGFLPWRRMNDVKLVEQKKEKIDLSLLNYGREEVYQPNSMAICNTYLKVALGNESYFYTPPPYRLLLNEIENDLLRRNCRLDNIVLDWMRTNPQPNYYNASPMKNYQNYQNTTPKINKNQHHKTRQTPKVTPKKFNPGMFYEHGDRSVRFY